MCGCAMCRKSPLPEKGNSPTGLVQMGGKPSGHNVGENMLLHPTRGNRGRGEGIKMLIRCIFTANTQYYYYLWFKTT